VTLLYRYSSIAPLPEEPAVNALPALSLIATDAIRAQFAASPEPAPRSDHRAPSRVRLALAAFLERAAHAVAPAGHSPAH
jgi:hypothetical protein